MKRNPQDLEKIAHLTLEHYNQYAEEFWQGQRAGCCSDLGHFQHGETICSCPLTGNPSAHPEALPSSRPGHWSLRSTIGYAASKAIRGS
jgi:hypothetical protein